MTSPRRPARPLRSLTRVGAWLLAVLAAVGLLVLSAGTASAATLPDGQTRVRACAPETITAVGVSEHIAAGQGRGPPALRGQLVVATGVAADSAVEATAPIKVNWGQQEKHFPGHPNFQLGRSTMTENPERLIERAGSGTPVGSTARGIPGFKERVDFEEVIGMWVPREGGDPIPTTIGMLHYGSRGIHIVPARP